MTDYMIWIWLAVFIICIILEAITFDLVSIWFALGSLVAMIVAAATDLAYYYQILIFALVSLMTLVLTRPFLKKLLKNQERSTNADDLIGKEVVVQDEISKFNPGSVKISGVIYQAILPENETDLVRSGEVVTIIAIKGNKIVVRKR